MMRHPTICTPLFQNPRSTHAGASTWSWVAILKYWVRIAQLQVANGSQPPDRRHAVGAEKDRTGTLRKVRETGRKQWERAHRGTYNLGLNLCKKQSRAPENERLWIPGIPHSSPQQTAELHSQMDCKEEVFGVIWALGVWA